MNIHERNSEYGDINKEIQKLLASNEAKPISSHSYSKNTETDILTLLESLNKTYNEINAALRTENSEALKDVILKSDIKMNMACETLLSTLRSTIAEKNDLIKENQNLDKLRRDFESKEFTYKLAIEKLKNEAEFKKTNLDELNRIIHDQKSRMADLKEESLKCKNDVNFYKAKIDELENLRGRAAERLSVFEKELDALNFVIKEKDERILSLVNEKKIEEDKNLNIKTRMAELESLNEVLNKKMDVKDKNLALCNSELSKVLCENKRLKIDFEKYKESSSYYEGLYKSLSTQNNYLNSQLNKMLNNAEYSKDIDGFIAKYKSKLKKAANKIKKLKFQLQEYEDTRSLLPDETTESLNKKLSETSLKNENYKKQIEELMNDKKKLEEKIRLGQHNYQSNVTNDRKFSIGSNTMPSYSARHTSPEDEGISYRTSSKFNKEDNSQEMPSNRYAYNKGEDLQERRSYLGKGYENNTIHNKEDRPLDRRHYDSRDSKNLLRSNLQNYFSQKDALKDSVTTNRPDLDPGLNSHYSQYNEKLYDDKYENNYTEPSFKSKVNELYERYSLDDKRKTQQYSDLNGNKYQVNYKSNNDGYNFFKSKDEKNLKYDTDLEANNTYMKLFNLENNYDERKDPLKDSLVGGLVDDVDVPESKLDLKYSTDRYINPDYNQHAQKPMDLDYGTRVPKEQPSKSIKPASSASKEVRDDVSVESVKTVHTSSTLKAMLARTETLQKKFADLENKLADINEGESVDKLTDKIKTYNSYYSDWNVDSNDSDYM